MNTTHPDTPPAASNVVRMMTQNLRTLSEARHGLNIAPRHRAILAHGQECSQRLRIKPALMPGTSPQTLGSD